jgi:pimeloyl-ACP methyl ester carboxylesterase
MTSPTATAPQNSTTVRAKLSPQILGLRAAFGTLDRLAPPMSGRLAARVWCTLPKPNGRLRDDRPVPGLFVEPSTTSTVRLPGGRRIAVERWGEGLPIYLVHGWGGQRGQLGPFVEPLVRAGYSVIAHDALCHGDSGPGRLGPRRTHGGEMMEALNAVVATFGQPHAIVGHSLGCAIAAFSIADGLPAPRRLGFVAPATGPLPHMRMMIQLLGIPKRTESAMIRRVEAMVDRPMTDFDALGITAPMPPTLIVHDYRDKMNSHAITADLAAAWPSAELHSTDGLGHVRILRDAGVVKRIAEFVTG